MDKEGYFSEREQATILCCSFQLNHKWSFYINDFKIILLQMACFKIELRNRESFCVKLGDLSGSWDSQLH